MSIFTCCEREDETKYLHTCACPSATFSCESESISPELCGHGENTGFISSPPKKYRLQTTTKAFGSYTLYKCCQPTFTDPYETSISFKDVSTNSYVHTTQYDAITCAITANTTSGSRRRTNYSGCPSSPSGTTTTSPYNDYCGGYIGNVTGGIVSATFQQYNCSDSGVFSPGSDCPGLTRFTVSGSGDVVLSEEDTDQEAIDRETPASGTSCSSTWQTRSTGFSWVKRTSGYTIECDDLIVGLEYEVKPAIRRRTVVIGSFGVWEDVTVTPVTFTATATTETIDQSGSPIALDHIQGYEYEITGVNIEKTV